MKVNGSAFQEFLFGSYLLIAIVALLSQIYQTYHNKDKYYPIYILIQICLLCLHGYLAFVNQSWLKVFRYVYGFNKYNRVRKIEDLNLPAEVEGQKDQQNSQSISQLYSYSNQLKQKNQFNNYDQGVYNFLSQNTNNERRRVKVNNYDKKQALTIGDYLMGKYAELQEQNERDSSRKFSRTSSFNIIQQDEGQDYFQKQRRKKQKQQRIYEQKVQKNEKTLLNLKITAKKEKENTQKTKHILCALLRQGLQFQLSNIKLILTTIKTYFNINITTQFEGITIDTMKRNSDSVNMTFDDALKAAYDGLLGKGKWKKYFVKNKTQYEYIKATQMLEQQFKKRMFLDKILIVNWKQDIDQKRNKAIRRIKKLIQNIKKGHNVYQQGTYEYKFFVINYLTILFNRMPEIADKYKLHLQKPERNSNNEFMEIVFEDGYDLHFNMTMHSVKAQLQQNKVRKTQQVVDYYCRPGTQNIFSLFGLYLHLLSTHNKNYAQVKNKSRYDYYMELFQT